MNKNKSHSAKPASESAGPSSLDKPTSCHCRGCRHERDGYDKINSLVAVVGLVLLAFYTTFAGIQSCTLKEQLLTADRPWVGASEVRIIRPLAHNAVMQVEVGFENSGRSPALRLALHTLLVAVTPGETPETIIKAKEPDCAKQKPVWSNKLAGTIYLPGEKNASFSVTGPILPDNQVDFLNGLPNASIAPLPSLGLWLVGCVDYFDQFHTPHRTYVCRYLVEGKQFFFCLQGNEGD